MKFLSWMHHKLMHNNIERMKNSTIDKSLFDEHCVEPSTYIKCLKASNSFEVDSVELPYQEESLDLFDFLSIGTFGMELPSADPPTPTLAMPYEKMSNNQTEITENDLKLISHELEKFLEAEEEIANDISARNSQAGLTNLNNKPLERADSEGQIHIADFPLQNYLFANATGLIEAEKEMKKEKVSLEELFRRNSTVTDNHKEIYGAEQHPRKKNAAIFVKKLLRKFCSSSSNSMVPSKNDAAASISIKKKLSKALKMLHKKVHPEEMTQEHTAKLQKGNKKNNGHKDSCQTRENDENNLVLQKNRIINQKQTMKLSPNGICKDASTINGEHWIKTDSDYLVLEL
ncbi:protein LAZY 1-like isoform X2 [Andrographis paniculata]|uniref:protein LAZY 1-like isoform X2 n=1 Tax=Andrographis paniculata TaxID=175694 RepID=UPI0021E98FC3|nr:protein LAZY 1-like isoform X2 [Andrographis paniculata]